MYARKIKFRCSNWNREWVISEVKLEYIKNWPDSCSDCGSIEISHELVEKTVIQLLSGPWKCNTKKNLRNKTHKRAYPETLEKVCAGKNEGVEHGR